MRALLTRGGIGRGCVWMWVLVLSAALASVPTSAMAGAGPGMAINPLEVLDAAGGALQRGEGVSSLAGARLPGAGGVGTGGVGAGDAGAGSGGARGGEGGGLSTALNVMLLLTVVTLAPSIMLMCTCFMRVLIVLGLLKQALGAQSVPPPQVITALALFMTMLVMAPTVERIHAEAIVPQRAGQVEGYDELWRLSSQPVRDFMFAQIEATDNWSSLYMVLEYRGVDTSDPSKLTRGDVDMVTLIPAFMLSELKVAFLMGFRVYLPFLVIDMVISTMLISMSMMMLPPVLISLPFKLLLFVLVDGWTLVVGSLMTSFVQPEASQAAISAAPVLHAWIDGWRA